jgi:iron complex transport system substrate-binding protein
MVCPEGLASVASGIDARDAIEYENADMGELTDLPETGLMALGSNSAIEKSKLAWAAPDIILDVGLPKEGLMGDLDRLQAKTGKPCVFVDISFGKLPDAYRIVGDILGVRTRTEQLACYVEDVCARIERGRKDRLGQCAAFYAPRFLGLEAKNSISLQNDVMNFIGASPVASPYDYTGETVDLTILASEDVDLVLFDDTSCLESLTKGEGEAYDIWSALPAVAEGRYVVAPALMHSWFGSMVIAQSIGALWLANVIWPKEYDLDMVHEASIFYELFYGLHCDEEMLRSLIGTYSEEGYAHD